MAKIYDCSGLETMGGGVNAARKAKRLARKTLSEMVLSILGFLPLLRTRNHSERVWCDTAYLYLRTCCGKVLADYQVRR